MKVKCFMSHEVPGISGRFTVYEAGQEYDLENPEEKFFKPVSVPVPPVIKKTVTRAKEVENDSN